MKDEYISIAEFAQRAGVSRQAIYSRLNRDLSRFCKLDNSKKVLSIKGLSLFDVKPDKQDLSPFDVLSKELEFKNKEIEWLRAENKRLSDQLLAVSDKLGNTLQAFSQAQVADKMIEGSKLIQQCEDQSEVASASNRGFFSKLFSHKKNHCR